jgi:hypothetical protein
LGLLRFFDFALLTFLVWLVWSRVIHGWRAAIAASRVPPPSAPGAAGTAARQQPAAVTLERCTGCGTYVPVGRMLPGAAGEAFCSEACRTSGARPTG